MLKYKGNNMDINMNSDQYKDKDMLKDEIIGDICSQCVLCTKRKLFGNISYIFEQFSGVCKWNYAMFISIILLQIAKPADSSTTASSGDNAEIQGSLSTYVEDENDDVPKAVVTLAGLLIFFVAAFALAKLIDYCHDRRAIRDDASDISDYTKQLLKSQMMMMAFRRGRSKGKKLKPKEAALKFGKMWRAKVARNKARLMKVKRDAITEALAQGKEPEEEVKKAVAIYEEKRIKGQMNISKTDNKPEKKDTEMLQLKVEKLNDGETGAANAKKPPIIPPVSDEKKQDTAKLFIVSETHSNQKSKPVENSSSKTTVKPLAKTSSRPISAGLKSRPVSAKSVKSRKTFGNLLKK